MATVPAPRKNPQSDILSNLGNPRRTSISAHLVTSVAITMSSAEMALLGAFLDKAHQEVSYIPESQKLVVLDLIDTIRTFEEI